VTHEHYPQPPTAEEYLQARDVALRLRAIAQPGTEAGLFLHHLSNAIGADPQNEWAPIVMRAMTDRARELLGE
jgi:hypothetical protein